MHTHRQKKQKAAAKLLDAAAHEIVSGFKWAETSEGVMFWAAQRNHLKTLARQLRKMADNV